MTKKRPLQQLIMLFEQLGAEDAEDWARSEIEEDIPQLARYLFLRQAWRRIIPHRDNSWIEDQIAVAKHDPGGPGSGIGPALNRVLAHGVEPSDLSEIVRAMQSGLLFDICYLIDDPGDVEPEVHDVNWALFEVNEANKPGRIIAGLHDPFFHWIPPEWK
jgi:hypothetical protein